MNRICRQLDQWWFEPATAQGLAVLRVLVGGYSLYYLFRYYELLQTVTRSRTSLFEPVGVASWLSAPLPPVALQLLLLLTLALGVAFFLGWAYRISGPGFALLMLFVLCYRNSWSMIYHSHNLLALHLMVLGFSGAADAFSLDSLARRLLGAAKVGGPHWRYGWPMQLLRAVTVAAYFLAGIAKIVGPQGLAWAGGASLRSQVAIDGLRKELLGSEATELSTLLYDHLWLFTLMGVATLVLELGAPLVLLHKRGAFAWAVVMYLFHWGILLMMGITFRYQLCGIAFAAFFVPFALGDMRQGAQEKARERIGQLEHPVPTGAVAQI